MKKAFTISAVVCTAFFAFALNARAADFTPADIAGTWDHAGTEYIIVTNGVFTTKIKGPTGNINTTTGTFTITGGDRLQFKKPDGRPWLSFKIVGISPDRSTLTVRVGTMVQTWTRK